MNKKRIRKMIMALAVMMAVASNTVFAEEPVDETAATESTTEETAPAEESVGAETQNEEGVTTVDVSTEGTDNPGLTEESKEENIDANSDADTSLNENVEGLEEDKDKEDKDKEDKDETEEDVEEESEEDDEVKLVETELTASVGEQKIKLTGNLPEGTELKVRELDDMDSIVSRVRSSIGTSKGFYPINGFEIELSYSDEDGTKTFVPADFDEACTVKVSKLGRKETASVYALNDGVECLSNDGATFTLEDKTAFAVGITYDCSCSICAKLLDGKNNCTVCAHGDGVTYITTVNSGGWYLFTDLDYSKSYFGCCFEITTE